MNIKTIQDKKHMARQIYLITDFISLLLIIIMIVLFLIHCDIAGYVLLICAIITEMNAVYWLGYLRGIRFASVVSNQTSTIIKED